MTPTANIYFYIEIALIILVVYFQIIHSLLLLLKIKSLRTIFKNKLFIWYGVISRDKIGLRKDIEKHIVKQQDNSLSIDENCVKITLVGTEGTNEVITRIQQNLNAYLINNYGAAVNFSIIKDIIDREVDINDEDISQSIPTPLYLGLAATMIGIIFGLLAMPKLDGVGFSEGINALIRGVQFAMFASLSGLTCTTILSAWFYKKAKRTVFIDKNDQLSYLQSELLPELVKAEDTGVEGLKTSLDRFAREATRISNNVRISTIETGHNLKSQHDLISKVENLDMTKIVKVNLELFDHLDSNMLAFNHFSQYISLMDKVSENLLNFSKRTENIETITQEIKSTIKDSNELTKFLTSHLSKIQSAGDASLTAVDLSDSHFREAIDKLTYETNSRIAALNKLADHTESMLKETFDIIGERLNEVAEKHLNKLYTAYSVSIPNFEQLDNLKVLPDIKAVSIDQSKELIESINLLNRSLKNISDKIDNQPILARLDSIEIELKTNTTTKEPINLKTTPKESFFHKFRI